MSERPDAQSYPTLSSLVGGPSPFAYCPVGWSVCTHRFEATNEAWANAVGEWYDQSGLGLLRCPRCSERRSVVEWQHDPVYGYGNLGFEFWNWPTLRAEFVQAVGERLSHPVVLVSGKL